MEKNNLKVLLGLLERLQAESDTEFNALKTYILTKGESMALKKVISLITSVANVTR